MTLKRKLLSLRHTLRLLPELLAHLDSLQTLLPKLVALEPVINKIGGLDSRVAELQIIEATVPRLEALDAALAKIDRLSHKTVVHEPVVVDIPVANHEYEQLKRISKFASLVGKAKEIDQEWQRIQQDEHDAFFAFQVMRGNNEKEYAYKKGISDGIKWCVERFS